MNWGPVIVGRWATLSWAIHCAKNWVCLGKPVCIWAQLLVISVSWSSLSVENEGHAKTIEFSIRDGKYARQHKKDKGDGKTREMCDGTILTSVCSLLCSRKPSPAWDDSSRGALLSQVLSSSLIVLLVWTQNCILCLTVKCWSGLILNGSL